MYGVEQIFSNILERYFVRWDRKTSSFQRNQLDLYLFWSAGWRTWSMLSQLYALLALFLPAFPIGYIFNLMKDSIEKHEVNDILLYGSNAIGYVIGALMGFALTPVVMHLLWGIHFKKEIHEYLTQRNINETVPITITGKYIRNFFLMLAVFMLVVVFMRKEKLDSNGIIYRDYFSLTEYSFKYSDVKEIVHYRNLEPNAGSPKMIKSTYRVFFNDGQYYQLEPDRPDDELQAIIETIKLNSGLPLIEKPFESR